MVGTGTYYARKVPKCDSDGTDNCSGNFVKSLDGTRAFYHIDPNPGSNAWVFFFDGGGACGEMARLNAAQACFEGENSVVGFYGYDKNTKDAFEMTTKHASGGYTVRNRKEGTGILSTDAANPYASGRYERSPSDSARPGGHCGCARRRAKVGTAPV